MEKSVILGCNYCSVLFQREKSAERKSGEDAQMTWERGVEESFREPRRKSKG